MIGHNLRESVLVTKENTSFAAAGTQVWSLVGTKAVLNIPVGTLFAMDVTTQETVDGTSAPFYNPIRVGMAMPGNTVRWLAGEELFPKLISSMDMGLPRCGNPEVVDLTWKCTECYEYYGITVEVKDNDTMSYGPAATHGEQFFVAATPDCTADCGDCTVSAICDPIRDELIAKLNAEFALGDAKAFATRLYENSRVFCFKLDSMASCFDDAECNDYNGVSAVTGVTFPVGFEFDTIPTTLVGLHTALQDVADLINADDAFEGSAFVTSGFGPNCCVQLHINSTDAITVTDVDAVAYDVCTEPINEDIPDRCGIRIIGAPIFEDTSCYLPRGLGYYARTVDIYATSPSFIDAETTKVSTHRIPQNFGTFVMHEEYKQETGGQGRKYRKGNFRLEDGLSGNFDSTSRISNAISNAEQDLSYVSIHIEHRYPHNQDAVSNAWDPAPATSSIYFPECNATALCTFVSFLEELADAAGIEPNFPDLDSCDEGTGGTGGTAQGGV